MKERIKDEYKVRMKNKLWTVVNDLMNKREQDERKDEWKDEWIKKKGMMNEWVNEREYSSKVQGCI